MHELCSHRNLFLTCSVVLAVAKQAASMTGVAVSFLPCDFAVTKGAFCWFLTDFAKKDTQHLD